jgi:hypothetical protein
MSEEILELVLDRSIQKKEGRERNVSGYASPKEDCCNGYHGYREYRYHSEIWQQTEERGPIIDKQRSYGLDTISYRIELRQVLKPRWHHAQWKHRRAHE